MRKSGPHISTGHRFYSYDEAGRVLGEYDASGSPIEEYVYLDGFRPVALIRGHDNPIPSVYPILTDHLGTPRKVLDSSGAAQWSWDVKDPYGHQMPNQLLGSSTFIFDLRFPGQRYDMETGLYHNGFRDYNPATGRYIQPDPIGLAGGWNPYAYVGGNPVNGIDPFGLRIVYSDTESREAVSFLKNSSPRARKAIEEAENSFWDLNITANRDANPEYKQLSKTIVWNPDLFMCDKNGNIVATPELQLYHEIEHFNQSPVSRVATWILKDMAMSLNDILTGGDRFRLFSYSAKEMEVISPDNEHSVSHDLGLRHIRNQHITGDDYEYKIIK